MRTRVACPASSYCLLIYHNKICLLYVGNFRWREGLLPVSFLSWVPFFFYYQQEILARAIFTWMLENELLTYKWAERYFCYDDQPFLNRNKKSCFAQHFHSFDFVPKPKPIQHFLSFEIFDLKQSHNYSSLFVRFETYFQVTTYWRILVNLY